MLSEWRITENEWPDAVADATGPQIVVAGPGTGKTEFLVRRASHLIHSGQVSADELLLLTFSRRAAADLGRRVQDATDQSSMGATASTFHSFALRLLETHGPTVHGWASMPAVLTGPEQVGIVAKLLQEEDPADWPLPFREILSARGFASEVTDFILRARERLLTGEALRRVAAERDDWRALPAFVERYDRHLADTHRIDYGTLQSAAVGLLEDLAVRAAVAGQYRYVIVDEYQDTTVAQAELLHVVTDQTRDLCVAADPAQSIYGFRGAELHNVAAFPDLFRAHDGSPARRLVLTQSFRVPSQILGAAERLVGGALPGAAGPVEPAPHAGRVETHVFDQQSREADWIAAEVERLHLEERIPFRDIAVLVRTKQRFLPELSRALSRHDIPHDPPDARLSDHPAVRIVADITRLAVHHDAAPDVFRSAQVDAAVRRLLLGPLFTSTLTAQRDLLRRRARTGAGWTDVLRSDVEGAGPIADLVESPGWATDVSATDGFWHLWTSVPQFETMVLDPDHADFRAAWTSLAQTLQHLAERDDSLSLADYLDLADQDEFEATPMLSYRPAGEDRLTLTTLHQAKGLEFDVVFIADAVEGVLPDLRQRRSVLQIERLSGPAPDSAEDRRERLLEEMRLAYTAMTRARTRVVWTATAAGIDEGGARPSRFLPAIAGVDGFGALGPPDETSRRPVTVAEAEARLRSVLSDPTAARPVRLAAAHILAERPHPGIRHPDDFARGRVRGGDAEVLVGPTSMSPSQVESYERCPRRYVMERRLRIGDEPSLYMTFGTMMHEVLERAEQQAIDDGRSRSTADEARAILDEIFDDYDFGAGSWAAAWRRRGDELIEGLYELWPHRDAAAELVEQHVSLTIEGIEWRGVIDRVERNPDGTVRIVDYKTTKTPMQVAEAQQSIQLGFYLLAAAEDPVISALGTPTEAELWYPANRRAKTINTRAFDPDALDDVRRRMVELATRLQTEDWEARPNDKCDRCPVRISCPEWPEGREAFVR